MIDIKARLVQSAARTEEILSSLCKSGDADLQELFDAEKYSLLGGGKRVRPFITEQVCIALGGDERVWEYYGAALEMIHTYSLIHDDLPCMDNDDMRRGRPTNHKVFGYATALLAGDALLTKAFEVAASNPYGSSEQNAEAVRLIAAAAGECGMIGGQIIDLAGEGKRLDFDTLIKLHSLKTGALIRCAAALGALSAGYRRGSAVYEAAVSYADGIGLAFQVVDDILDATATETELGKSVGGDKERGKTTFLSYFSVEDASAYAERVTREAVGSISAWGNNEALVSLAYYLTQRKN